jgi:SAM-dependent methyltransferase
MLRENDWECYYEKYRESPERFTRPIDDREVIVDIFDRLKNSSESPPSSLKGLVIGAGGSLAVREFSEIFWESISSQEEDRLSFVDIRSFKENDKESVVDLNEKSFLIQGNGCTLPFEDGAFNLIFTHCLFECLSNPDLAKIMREMDRVTEKRGFGIHTFRDFDSLGKFYEKSVSFLKRKSFGVTFTPRLVGEVEGMLNENNFQVMDKGLVGKGFNECQNLTVGCVKRIERKKRRFKKRPFVV